jgi:hypothetical protein
MRIRRTIIAPVILTISAIGSLAAPAVAAMTSAPAATSVAANSSVFYYHT